MKSVVQEAFAAARVNNNRLKSCKKHSFSGNTVIMFGAKYVCENCKGSVDLNYVGIYISGYEAAGGVADDIWPGWREKADV